MKVGITFSTFDLLHAGHVSMLREAKSVCDYLICGLQVDPSIDRKEKNSPIQTLVERHIQLSGVKYVDEIISYQNEEDVVDILEMFSVDVKIMGAEYKDRDFTGKAVCERKNIQLYFNNRSHRFSSSDLRKRVACGENLCYNDFNNKTSEE